MSGLPILNLNEPLVDALVSVLSTGLNGVIDQLNAAYNDAFPVEHVVQFLPYVPVPSALEGGMPVVGVQDLPSEFRDDIQSSMHALHEYAVVAVLQEADHELLTVRLRRTMQAITYTIQADRLLDKTSVMKTQGGAWMVNFLRTEPGPLLGDANPLDPEAPPRSYLSYTALVLASERAEI